MNNDNYYFSWINLKEKKPNLDQICLIYLEENDSFQVSSYRLVPQFENPVFCFFNGYNEISTNNVKNYIPLYKP